MFEQEGVHETRYAPTNVREAGARGKAGVRGYKAVRASPSLGSVDSAGVYEPGRSSQVGYIASFIFSWG